MKNLSVVGLSLVALVGIALCVPTLAAELDDVAAKGAKLFADPSLGTNGKSCATCHGDGKVWVGQPRFPKVALGGPHTLDQALQICFVNALAGKPLAWDDERLTALAVFVDRAYGKPAK